MREDFEPSLRHIAAKLTKGHPSSYLSSYLSFFSERNRFDFQKSQLDRRRAPEDRDADSEEVLVGVDLLDRAHEAGEGAVRDSHRLAAFEGEFRLRLFSRDRDVMDDLVDLLRRQ